MKLIYHCYGGAHSSVVAASLHVGLLAKDRSPTLEELLELPYFDIPRGKDHGQLQYFGTDEKGYEVYNLGRRNAAKQIESVLLGSKSVFPEITGETILVDVLGYVNWIMVLGGYTSRKLGITRIGRPVVSVGTQKSFWKLVALVEQVKKGLRG